MNRSTEINEEDGYYEEEMTEKEILKHLLSHMERFKIRLNSKKLFRGIKSLRRWMISDMWEDIRDFYIDREIQRRFNEFIDMFCIIYETDKERATKYMNEEIEKTNKNLSEIANS